VPPAAPAASPNAWALNDEAIQNLGYMQMKKTLDAARVLAERMYGERPSYTYYIGGSQGGREGLTVAQRYPDDYDGVVATVPILNFSTLMLAPELIRIQEKPLVNWVPPAKVNAIRGEFMRQCDNLDGLVDGLINNYLGCRAVFDVNQGTPGRDPWAAKRCTGNVDPDPANTTETACLTSGQIETLEFIYTPYPFATPLAHGVTSFGMWLPTMDPGGSGLLIPARYRGQEGAAPDAPTHSHLGIVGVTGFLMQDLAANPLDYVEGGPLNARRQEISRWLDATDPDLSPFARSGGKMIVAIGTDDSLASTGAQVDYYQSVIDRMGRSSVDTFARFYVVPEGGHGLSGNYYRTNGAGEAVEVRPIPNQIDRLALIMRWVEEGIAPGMSEVVTSANASLPLCSYPTYPMFVGGPVTEASSYTCASP
jgi:feruloyl esterase